MADNLLDMAKREIGSSGTGALSSALGLPADKGGPAFESGLSTVLAGMLNKGSSKTGMGNLFNTIVNSGGGAGGLDLSSLADTAKDPQKLSSLQNKGASLLNGVFGGKAESVGNLLTSSIGGGAGSGGNLLKVAAPVVVSLLSKQVKSKGLDVSDLGSLLQGQKSFIKDKLPSGVINELGVSNFDKLGGALTTHGHEQPQEPRPEAIRKPGKKRGGFGKWFWPLLIALVALYALNMCAKRDKMEEKPSEIILEQETMTTEPPPPQATQPDQADFATGFREYLANTARDPNREFPLAIQFARDSAQVTSRTVPDVDALVKMMQENASLSIAIEGHTSSEGDEARNQQLSQERADAVRQLLVSKGIAANRVTAVGMGSAKLIVGDGSSVENRRVSVRVVNF